MNDQQGLALKMAAHLISESQKKGLDSAILDSKDKSITDEVIDGAKRAESYLDVPLKDRPRDPFQDSIPSHLDRPLRALLGFVDDSLPEYSKFKFWEARKELPLDQKIDSVVSLSRGIPLQTVDMKSLGQSIQHIKDESQLNDTPLTDEALSKQPQEVLKSQIAQSHWNVIDKTVMQNVLDVAKFVQDGIPQGFRLDAVPQIIQDVAKLSYEILARRMLNSPTRQQPLSLDPSKLAETVLSAGVLGQDVEKIAGEFPSIFSIFAGLAVVPPTMAHKFQNLLAEFKGPLSVETLLKSLNSGKVNFIMVHEIDQDLFKEAAKKTGAHDQEIAKLNQDVQSASKNPFMSALAVKSEAKDRQAFQSKKDEVRQNLSSEVQRMLQPKPEQAPDPQMEGSQEVFEDGVSGMAIPEDMFGIDQDPDNPETSPQDDLETTVNGPASPEQASGWQEDKGRAGVALAKGDNIVVKDKEGYRAWKGSENLGVFLSPDEASRAIDASI